LIAGLRWIAGSAAAVAAIVLLSGTAARAPQDRRATGSIAAGTMPYLPGSVLPVRVDGFAPPYRVAVVGPGAMLENGLYAIPVTATPGSALLVAGNAQGLASRSVTIGEPPAPGSALIAVACYDDGIVLHRAAGFAVAGTLAIGGPPVDVAANPAGGFAASDTQGTTLTALQLAPWNVIRVQNVPFGDAIAVDGATRAVFVTNRDLDGSGALTRVLPDGTVSQLATGKTAEGVAIDERRQIVYVANVNDDTVAAVDARSMQLLRRFHAVSRVFSLALSPSGTRLYAVSNQTLSPPLGAPGSVVAIALGSAAKPRVVARSANLTFPVSEALDARRHTLFVTDEAADRVYVLDAATLRPKRPPLSTCRTPWKPAFDPVDDRLYVPCARSDEVDVFDATTDRRVRGAPFATGSYPLAVAVWHPAPGANR